MKVSNLLLQINQGLVELGKYAPGRLLNTEILQTLDVELGTLYNTVVESKAVELDSFTAALLNDLKDTKSEKSYTIGVDYFTYSLPSDLVVLLKASIITTYFKEVLSNKLTVGKYYKPNPQAKINSVWTSDVTKATEEGYNGKLLEVEYYKYAVRLTPSEKIDVLKSIPFYKSKFTSPLGEIEQNTLKLYLEDCIPDSIEVTYYKKPFLFSVLKETDDSPYSELVNNKLIKLCINNIKQRQ